MPKEHSKLYDQLTASVLDDAYDDDLAAELACQPKLSYENIELWLKTDSGVIGDDGETLSPYEQLSDVLRETNDAQFGIVSTLEYTTNADGKPSPQWVRDATDPILLNSQERIAHDHPVIEGNNALLRCLSRLRAIDYAIEKKYSPKNSALTPEEIALGQQIRAQLKNDLLGLMNNVLAVAKNNQKKKKTALQEIIDLEKQFDTTLIERLHKANLTKGCSTAKSAKDLLFHYRNLSSLLVPARTMVTLTYDEKYHILHRDTQYPVTKKTAEQKTAIEELRKIQPYPFDNEKNAHNCRNMATQEADSLFVDLMVDDKRRLPAQARKTHSVGGARNAYIVETEVIPLGDESLDDAIIDGKKATEENTLWQARMGTAVYVGKGESYERIQEQTVENLTQIKQTAAELISSKENNNPIILHVACLNTDSRDEHQNIIIDHLGEAANFNPRLLIKSNMPINPEGTLHAMKISSRLIENESIRKGFEERVPGQRATRANNVVGAIEIAQDKYKDSNSLTDLLPVITCASGQDRTGIIVEKVTQNFIVECYCHIPDLEITGNLKKLEEYIQTKRAEAFNAAEIATESAPGSPGIKPKSEPKNVIGGERIFNKSAAKEWFLKSANTNKENPVDNDGVEKLLQRPSPQAVTEYKNNLDAFSMSINKLKQRVLTNKSSIKTAPLPNGCGSDTQEIYDKAIALQKNIRAIVNDHPDGEEHPEKIPPKQLAQLSSILVHADIMLKAVNGDSSISKKTIIESGKRLASFSKRVLGKSSPELKALGAGLLTFTGGMLVALGVFALVITPGLNLITAIAAGATAVTAIGGGGFAIAGIKKKLAGALGEFTNSNTYYKKALKEMKVSDKEDERKELVV